jgi:thiol-disulfide isomerase/thioredoxin
MTTYGAVTSSFCGWLIFSCAVAVAQSAAPAAGPTNEKAQKTYKQALEHAQKHQTQDALDAFRKADKQDDGHCVDCQKRIVKYGIELRDWKAAEGAAEELLAEAQGPRNIALAQYQAGVVALYQGLDKHKDELFSRAHEHFTKALESAPNFPDAVFGDGKALAHLHQDDAAKARFEQFAKMPAAPEVDRQRALRFVSEPELARAKMAPAFEVDTMDGKHISLDELKGKVVLIDFWATWCGPCRKALPHMREIAKKFKDEPLVVLSVSLDDDEQKWKDFIQKNEMTWPQCRDEGGFKGQLPQLFAVNAIPHTFTIDADGVLQDEHIGDASVKGKLKKLLAHAHELQLAAKNNEKASQ